MDALVMYFFLAILQQDRADPGIDEQVLGEDPGQIADANSGGELPGRRSPAAFRRDEVHDAAAPA